MVDGVDSEKPRQRVATSLAALGSLTHDMLRDLADLAAPETEAFVTLADEIDTAVSRLADGYMTLKLRLALNADRPPPVSSACRGCDGEAESQSLEQLLFPSGPEGSDNALLDELLAHETAGSLNVMDSGPSPLDDLVFDAPLVPERSHSADTFRSDDLREFSGIFSEDVGKSWHTSPDGARCSPRDPATAIEDAPAAIKDAPPPSAERLRSWHEEGGTNLRALLASLHTVVPPGSACAWERTSLSELVGDTTVKRAYQRSLLAVHPDKLPPPQREAGQQIFDTLRDAWGVHKRH